MRTSRVSTDLAIRRSSASASASESASPSSWLSSTSRLTSSSRSLERDETVDLALQVGEPAGDPGRVVLVVPEVGGGHLLAQIGDLDAHAVEVEHLLDGVHGRLELLDLGLEVGACHEEQHYAVLRAEVALSPGGRRPARRTTAVAARRAAIAIWRYAGAGCWRGGRASASRRAPRPARWEAVGEVLTGTRQVAAARDRAERLMRQASDWLRASRAACRAAKPFRQASRRSRTRPCWVRALVGGGEGLLGVAGGGTLGRRGARRLHRGGGHARREAEREHAGDQQEAGARQRAVGGHVTKIRPGLPSRPSV